MSNNFHSNKLKKNHLTSNRGVLIFNTQPSENDKQKQSNSILFQNNYSTQQPNLTASRPKTNQNENNQPNLSNSQNGLKVKQKRSPLRFKALSPQSERDKNKQNSSQSPTRIIPINQIKIVHSPQPFKDSQQNSPMINVKQVQVSDNRLEQKMDHQANIDLRNGKQQCNQNLNKMINNQNTNQHKRRHSRQNSIIDMNEFLSQHNIQKQEEINTRHENEICVSIPANENSKKQITQAKQQLQETLENQCDLQPFKILLQQKEESKQTSLEDQIRKSLSELENNLSSSKRTSRNCKSRNSGDKTSHIITEKIFQESNKNTLDSQQEIKVQFKESNRSFFLNKVKNCSQNNFQPNAYATQSTTITAQNQERNLLNTFGNQTKSSLSGQGQASFDNEMKRHGLVQDIKKLDSFNRFIEQHSPKQTRQNSCTFLGDELSDSLQIADIQQTRLKRCGSGDLAQLQQQNQEQATQKQTSNIMFQFPFQRRTRSNSPPTQQQAAQVITNKLNENASPRDKNNQQDSILDSYCIDQSRQQILIKSKLNGPIKVQDTQNLRLAEDKKESDEDKGEELLKNNKYKELAEAVKNYLSGDYSKILSKNDNEGQDVSQDPDSILKQSQDVDEWLLGGLTEHKIDEDSLILKKIEENQQKQAQESVAKQVIIDDLFENDYLNENNSQDWQNYYSDRRVTTVVEQQTLEDLEDDDEEININSPSVIRLQENSTSSKEYSIKSLRNDTNSLEKIEIIEDFNNEENLIDENEERTTFNTCETNKVSQEKVINQTKQSDQGEDWMYKTFDNLKSFISPPKSSRMLTNNIQQQLLQSNSQSRNQLNKNKTQTSGVVKSQPKEFKFNQKKKGIKQRQKEDNSNSSKKSKENIDQISRPSELSEKVNSHDHQCAQTVKNYSLAKKRMNKDNKITKQMNSKVTNQKTHNIVTVEVDLISSSPEQKQKQKQYNQKNESQIKIQQCQSINNTTHKRQNSGSGHRHRRTQSKSFDPQFLDQLRNSEAPINF